MFVVFAEIIAYLLLGVFVDKVSKKKLIFFSYSTITIFSILILIFREYFLIFFMFGIKFFNTVTMSVVFLNASEIYGTSYRSTAISLLNIVMRLGAAIMPFIIMNMIAKSIFY
jgi:MFS family permease